MINIGIILKLTIQTNRQDSMGGGKHYNEFVHIEKRCAQTIGASLPSNDFETLLLNSYAVSPDK